MITLKGGAHLQQVCPRLFLMVFFCGILGEKLAYSKNFCYICIRNQKHEQEVFCFPKTGFSNAYIDKKEKKRNADKRIEMPQLRKSV